MDKFLYLGIDPGIHGCISFIDKYNPETPISFKMKDLTTKDISDILKEYSSRTAYAVLEKVNAMPKQGVVSVWKFSGSYHTLLMGLYCHDYSFDLIRPVEWQKDMGCLTGGDKNVSKARAQQLFPGIKITHDTADSLVIASYCKKHHAS